MSQDLTTAGPSRRSVAKGAAWTIPAVSVAAAAPSIAASTTCTPTVSHTCPRLLDRQSIRFTITNPSGSNCVIPAGTPITVSNSGLVGLNASLLNGINVGADLVFSSATSATTQRDLTAGQSITVNLFPTSLLNLGLLGTASVSILGVTDTVNYTILSAAGIINVALCR